MLRPVAVLIALVGFLLAPAYLAAGPPEHPRAGWLRERLAEADVPARYGNFEARYAVRYNGEPDTPRTVRVDWPRFQAEVTAGKGGDRLLSDASAAGGAVFELTRRTGGGADANDWFIASRPVPPRDGPAPAPHPVLKYNGRHTRPFALAASEVMLASVADLLADPDATVTAVEEDAVGPDGLPVVAAELSVDPDRYVYSKVRLEFLPRDGWVVLSSRLTMPAGGAYETVATYPDAFFAGGAPPVPERVVRRFVDARGVEVAEEVLELEEFRPGAADADLFTLAGYGLDGPAGSAWPAVWVWAVGAAAVAALFLLVRFVSGRGSRGRAPGGRRAEPAGGRVSGAGPV